MNFSDFLKKSWLKLSSTKETKKDIKVEDLFATSSIANNKSHVDSDLNINSYGEKIEDSEVINIVNDIFLQAMKSKASDIHIEPREKM